VGPSDRSVAQGAFQSPPAKEYPRDARAGPAKGKLITFQGQRPRTISRGTSFGRPAQSKLKWGKNSHLSVKRQASIEPLSNPSRKSTRNLSELVQSRYLPDRKFVDRTTKLAIARLGSLGWPLVCKFHRVL
jgi:hypothetical protein